MVAFIGKVIGVFFEYDTPRIVHIRSKKVGFINRFIQLCIIGYIIGYAIIFQKGYQEFDNVQGAITTKLKGVAETKNVFSSNSSRIWDVNDYVVPPQENLAFFVTTNLIVTDGQQMGVCDEDGKVAGANCTLDASICLPGEPLLTGDGYMTGACVETKRYNNTKVCEVVAWCPTEDGRKPLPNPPALAIAEKFTVFIKNNIEFPKFGVKRRNIVGFDDQNELRNCRFKLEDDKYKFCPIFVLGDIATYAGTQFVNIAQKGGVIQILISWNCNLDHGAENCLPEYSFRRLDEENDVLSPGYNFRFSRYYKDENGTDTRTLFKAYGIKFILTLQGRAGKFSIVPLVLNIGSGLALLSVATIICDIVVLYVLKSRALYKEKKYLEVVGDDAYEEMRDDSRAG
ncbi:P2X purinoceptor 4-like isoform X1 [Mya arenaria]|uniref:P2X purinoceptor 4-like isoform X1 n=1 Tax=Mya arenaria TaxID=6604 RepID=UPI0022E62858|nr:P2X purinoceptor 4-like isoform X1 [Mya arenaria]